MSSLAFVAFEQSIDAGPGRASYSAGKQAELGQFMTPDAIADFMAMQFDGLDRRTVRLLDAGAGQGALSAAFARRWASVASPQAHLTIDAFELDGDMVKTLGQRARQWEQDQRIRAHLVSGDFIKAAVQRIKHGDAPYTHAILNPPYKKIGSQSEARRELASVGVETVNLYSGFVALAFQLLSNQGELVAIIPRSFCNGPYYRSFRNLILDKGSITSIHLFKSRNKAFAKDDVLQENVIIRLRKGGRQSEVLITTSSDATMQDLAVQTVSFDQIVLPGDRERFIHIPIGKEGDALLTLDAYRSTLADLDIAVSTGPVVDFRLKRHLRMMPGMGDVPLIYPGHLTRDGVVWPRLNYKKANALSLNAETARWLYPPGFYVVVRRFSSKEEKRRIVATVVRPTDLPDGPYGFENHLNVFHRSRGPLPEHVARGLATYLNAKVVDDWFRQFNGHTQVNATDLRSMPFPDTARLLELGRWSAAHPNADSVETDVKVGQLQ